MACFVRELLLECRSALVRRLLDAELAAEVISICYLFIFLIRFRVSLVWFTCGEFIIELPLEWMAEFCPEPVMELAKEPAAVWQGGLGGIFMIEAC